MDQLLYALLNKDRLDTIIRKDQDDMAFGTLMKSLRKSSALGIPSHQFPFFLFVCEKEEDSPGLFTHKHGDFH